MSAPTWACTTSNCDVLPENCVTTNDTETSESSGAGESEDSESGSSESSTGTTEGSEGTEATEEDTDSEDDASTAEDTDSEEDTGSPSICGNGEPEDGEACDDGNTVDGDGCDNDCTLTAVAALSLGWRYTCALIDGGRVRCWGYNTHGQLGYGHTNDIGDDELPSEAGDVLLPGPVTTLDLGGYHGCARFDDGDLRCWGYNAHGQLGNGGTDNHGDDETLADLDGLGLTSAIDVRLGSNHTCALLEGGNVRCWGHNANGQLGHSNVEISLQPGESLSIGGAASWIAAGGDHTCALLESGGLRCWGDNTYGQLGLGNIEPLGDNELPDAGGPISLGLPPDTEIVDIKPGERHTCILLSSDAVMCWGENQYGQLGLGHTDTIGDDELPSSQAPVLLPAAAKALAVGNNHTCVLLTGGEVMCWGRNISGELGLGHTDNIGDGELPHDAGFVELGGSALMIAAGGRHTCALLENLDLRCWGYNEFGQLGLGHTDDVGDDELPADVDPVPVL
nr:hypothetical protein [Pseudenhygromyxa sp. WMMC2535]